MDQRIKYPRTPHLPWSPGASRDDQTLSSVHHFEGQHVVVTEKRDGENTTLYRNGLHARSITSSYHASRSWIQRLQAQIGHEIPEGWRICGENLYAQHSIRYTDLDQYFEVFSCWNQDGAASWDTTEQLCCSLGLQTVPVLYRGVWNRDILDTLWRPNQNREGYVVRLARDFPFAAFSQSVAKWVRPQHVTTDRHWKRTWVPNLLRGS